MGMTALGILFGLLTAFLQSVSYLFSKQLVRVQQWSMPRLLAMAHVLMGLAAIPVWWLVRPAGGFDPAADLPWAVGVIGFYLLGQAGLLYALKHTDASRVAPLLGLKIVMLAGFTVLLMDQPLSVMQWAGVLIATAAAFVLNHAGGRNPWPAVIAILATCACYSLSDLCIRQLIDQLAVGGEMQREGGRVIVSVRATAMSYLLGGVVGAAAMPWLGSRRVADWRAVTPYAAVWFSAMLFMFATIGLVNVVLANILQSTRGLMAIGLGVALAAAGWTHLEAETERGVLIRRIAAAVLMTGAVGLYVAG